MDDDVIDDIAYAFAEQLNNLEQFSDVTRRYYYEAILDDIIAMALVIHNHAPTYDLRYFYKNAGYPQPYPQHDM